MDIAQKHGLRIIVVDDDGDHNQLLGEILKFAGHEVSLCATGFEALAAMACGCDCLITDYHMPGMNGAELIRAVKGKYAPVCIVVTGSVGMRVQEEAVAAGAAVVLRKPTHPKVILSLLNTIATTGNALPPKLGPTPAVPLRADAFRTPLQ